MDLVQSIRMYTIPRWLRILLVLLTLPIIALNIYIFRVGLIDSKYDFWVSSGASLLSVVLPLILIGLLVSFSHGGHQALKDRTERLLTNYLPREFLRISEDYSDVFRVFRQPNWATDLFRPRITLPERSEVAVEVSYEKNDCIADYRIIVPRNLHDGEKVLIALRVEINVYKLNVVIWFAEKHQHRVDEFLGEVSHPSFAIGIGDGEDRRTTPFRNTILGAMKSGFTINRQMIERQHGLVRSYGVVLIKDLPKDFL